MPKSIRKRRSKRNKTGYFGVSKNTRGNKYAATISIDGKIKHLGSSYDTAKQAAKAYDKEAIKLRRPFSKLNYPKKTPVGYSPIQQALYSNKAVGYRGVYKNRIKFEATITIGGNKTYIGIYNTAKEAAIAYDRAVLKANQSTTLLNFPDMVHNLNVEPKRQKQKLQSRKKIGYRGVYKSGRKFRAMATINGKLKGLGTFGTAIGAALAYDQAAIKKGNKSHTLNFPDGLPMNESDEGFRVKKIVYV